MSKKTLGIILVVLGIAAVLGGFVNGSLLSMGIVPMIGFLAAVAALLYFGFKFIKQGK